MQHSAKGFERDPAATGNWLLDYLPRRQRQGVLAHCGPIELVSDAVLAEAGQAVNHVYFPTSGSISLLRTLPGHEPFETDSVGREGMLGLAVLLGVKHASQRAVVHAEGMALQMEGERVVALMLQYDALKTILQRYLHLVLTELSQSTGCVRFHDVGSRLARVLLREHDRASSDDLPLLTHRLLADMLGVQRGSVTIAAAKLQRRGVIRYSRGRITILDREALLAAACSCYAAGVAHYETMLPQHAAGCVLQESRVVR